MKTTPCIVMAPTTFSQPRVISSLLAKSISGLYHLREEKCDILTTINVLFINHLFAYMITMERVLGWFGVYNFDMMWIMHDNWLDYFLLQPILIRGHQMVGARNRKWTFS
jgi:hypothetical protein